MHRLPRLPRLRSKLLLLAAGSLAPLLILALVFAYLLVKHETEVVRTAAIDRNRTFLTAVDAQMQGHIAALKVLAASQSLAQGDLRSFDAEARRALASQPDWRNIMLIDVSGQHLVNLRFDYGAGNLPKAGEGELESVRRVFDSGSMSIGGIARGPVTQAWGIPVRLPVAQDGRIRYLLQFVLEPRALGALMELQRYPASWAIGLVDAKGLFIARQPTLAQGERASRDFWSAIQREREGWYRGKTREGTDTFTAHKTSDFTGWTVGVAIPSKEVFAAPYRATLYVLISGLASMAMALIFAWWLARHIARPITKLAEAARGVGQGLPPPPSLTEVKATPRIREVLEVAYALEDAAASVQEREALRLREQTALRAADKAKDEFLAMLGHELRNPLSAIVASAHVLRLSKPGDEAALQAHGVIDRQARQMTRLVEDLLDISRLAMGKLSLQRERLELSALIERVVQAWQQSGRGRKERMQVALAPAWVDADRARLEQVLANLLDNAEKFSPAGSRITLHLHTVGAKAVIEVQDAGRGIAADELPHVFELFVQGAQTVDRPQGGLGLGLTLVRRLVELHGGEVTAHSEERDRGACFTIRLPLADNTQAPAPATDAPRDADAEQRRVLLVEDNDDGRAVMELMLSMQGHMVRSAANGQSALRIVHEWQPDIALIDIGLPDINGHEVARRLRALPDGQRCKLIAISGYGQPQDLRDAYDAGFDLHVTKPIDPGFLREMLNAFAEQPVAR